MNLDEIRRRLTDARYRYDTTSGRYQPQGADGDAADADYATEDVADELGITLNDLLEWEEQQTGPSRH
jgi:hypothetical protein